MKNRSKVKQTITTEENKPKGKFNNKKKNWIWVKKFTQKSKYGKQTENLKLIAKFLKEKTAKEYTVKEKRVN